MEQQSTSPDVARLLSQIELDDWEGVPDRHVHAPWNSGQTTCYPAPIVDHAERRRLALERYKGAREKGVRL